MLREYINFEAACDVRLSPDPSLVDQIGNVLPHFGAVCNLRFDQTDRFRPLPRRARRKSDRTRPPAGRDFGQKWAEADQCGLGWTGFDEMAQPKMASLGVNTRGRCQEKGSTVTEVRHETYAYFWTVDIAMLLNESALNARICRRIGAINAFRRSAVFGQIWVRGHGV